MIKGSAGDACASWFFFRPFISITITSSFRPGRKNSFVKLYLAQNWGFCSPQNCEYQSLWRWIVEVGGWRRREQQCGARPHRFRIEAFFFFGYIWGEKFTFELFSNVNFSHLNNIWTKIAKLSNSVALDLAICFVLSNYLSDIWWEKSSYCQMLTFLSRYVKNIWTIIWTNIWTLLWWIHKTQSTDGLIEN